MTIISDYIHDIRTELNSASLTAELMQENAPDEMKDDLITIVDSIQKAAKGLEYLEGKEE